MPYTSFTIQKSKREKDLWKITCTSEREDYMGKWEGSGSYGDLYAVSGVMVLMNPLNQKPMAVFKSVDDCKKQLEDHFNCKVTIV